MNTFPDNLQEAIVQAKEATKNAIADGYTRVQVEFVIPEIPLQAQYLALEFAKLFEEYGSGVKVLFPDTGAAMLAKRDWGSMPFQVSDMGSRFTPIESKVADTDEVFILACPSSVEVERVEKLCNLAGDRPVVLLIPQLEDVAVVGIGLAARQLRDRFISTLYSCYYIRPIEDASILRCHPSPWQIWLEKEKGYELGVELSSKPMGEELDRLLLKLTAPEEGEESANNQRKKPGIFGDLQKFLKALSQ
ncbi:conserved hypothetical protein [Hyella patelloides LEGE 07179]|uniref:DUF1995 domain-containing protein n=1 Tax=Hyella patelloides LEGE 07179 TaxID=945734 RepID=A0A563VVG0_9CYAN|nr:DUF1995 family protein [Hyella patelloides]VEP15390.1 conserved hypothetical protein [Hyella patelloides LEGE 07179]